MANERQTYRKSAARSAASGRTGSGRGASSRSSASQSKASSKQGKSFGDKFDDVLESLLKGKNSKSKAATRTARGTSSAGAVDSFKTRFLSSKIAMIVAVVIMLLLVVGLWDNLANYGKAYGNVSVNGTSVAGMNADQIKDLLETEYGQKLQSGEVRIYASEAAKDRESSNLAKQESVAQAEQVSVEQAKASVTSWVTSASGLRASVPYDEVVDKALAAGRDGGPLGRMALLVAPQNIEFTVAYDSAAVEKLANAIDSTIGDSRVDSTVQVEEGSATAVKGHDGKMVDRSWLTSTITEKLLSDDEDKSFVAEVTDAPSRTTYEQAQQMATCINRALNSELEFKFKSQSWLADSVSMGNWTRVKVAQVSDGYELQADIDTAAATSDLAKHLDATVQGDDVIVDFEKKGDEIVVHTSGSGIIPEVGPAISQAREALYGSAGAAWGNGSLAKSTIDVNESDAPEELGFEQAVDLGIITVIGEYTTEYSNAEGTENRNHNIHVAADLLNNTITDSNGGTWSFNDHSGDTNQDPPFASAGSIVDGEYVDSIGGGICQVATTVFNAVYEAGLNIDERRNHSLYIASYPTGRDAAVSYPEMDFVWSNPLKSDTLLTLEYTDTTVTAKLYGTPTGYKVSTETGQWEEGEKYKTTFETDEELAEGAYYLKTTGSDGSQITVQRTVTDLSGNIVKQDSFASVYSPKDEVYLIGPGTDTSVLMQTRSESGTTSSDEWQPDGYEDESGTESYYEEQTYDDYSEEM